jgi:5-methylcytosine-specific restriction endonuclease McrA
MARSYAEYLQSPWWKLVRRFALQRARHRCQHPGCYATTHLEVHHLSYANLGNERTCDVRVLCASCHQRAHGLVPAPRERTISVDGVEHVSAILPRVLDVYAASLRGVA